MARVVSRFDPTDLPALLRPRQYPVQERSVGDGVFEAVDDAPVTSYRRTVNADESAVVQTIAFKLAVPYFAWFFLPFFRHALRSPARDREQGWAPPDRWDARASSVLGPLCFAPVLLAYFNAP